MSYCLDHSCDVLIYRLFTSLLSAPEIILLFTSQAYFSNLLVEIAFSLDGVRWMVMVMVAGIKNQLHVRAGRDKRQLRVSLATSGLESQLALVLRTVTEPCVPHFPIAMEPLEQIVALELFLLVRHDSRHFEDVTRLWRLVELHRVERNHASQRRVIHHVHVHHFLSVIDYFHAFLAF